MLSNIKTSDWIAAGIRGLTPVVTAGIGNALSGGEAPPPTISDAPSPEAQDASFRIFQSLGNGGDTADLDFTGNLTRNILTGSNSTEPWNGMMGELLPDYDPAGAWAQGSMFRYGTLNGIAGLQKEQFDWRQLLGGIAGIIGNL